jgi:hypothetical protein
VYGGGLVVFLSLSYPPLNIAKGFILTSIVKGSNTNIGINLYYYFGIKHPRKPLIIGTQYFLILGYAGSPFIAVAPFFITPSLIISLGTNVENISSKLPVEKF